MISKRMVICSLNIKFLGRIFLFLGHQGPRRRDIPDKNFRQVDREWPGRPGIWVGTSRILEKLYARKLRPKMEALGRRYLRTSGQKLRSGPPNPGKTSMLAWTSRADVHENNFGLKNGADFSFPKKRPRESRK